MRTQISNCICPECGNSFPIPRQPDRKRARGHRKKLWCPYCGKEVNMLEKREEDWAMDDLIHQWLQKGASHEDWSHDHS